jgi:hypothetical protein
MIDDREHGDGVAWLKRGWEIPKTSCFRPFPVPVLAIWKLLRSICSVAPGLNRRRRPEPILLQTKVAEDVVRLQSSPEFQKHSQKVHHSAHYTFPITSQTSLTSLTFYQRVICLTSAIFNLRLACSKTRIFWRTIHR